MKKRLHIFKKSSIAAVLLFFCFAQTQAQDCATAPTVDVGPASMSICSSEALLTGVLAGFVGPYSVENWTLSNVNADGSVNVVNAPSSISLTGGNNAGFNIGGQGDTFYSIIVPETGTITFNWDYTTPDVTFFDNPNIVIDVSINGTKTLLTGFNTTGSNNQSGTMSVNVVAGQTFAFNIFTVDNGFGAGTVTISNFIAPISATTSLQWTASNGGVISGADDQLSVVPAASGTYTLTATTGTCVSSDSVNVTFNASPTLSTVTAATACNGSTTNIMLSGLLQNTFGTATFKINNGPLLTTSGTTTAMGTFNIQTPILSSQNNGAVVEITKISTAAGCETSFTGKTVTLVVIPRPTLTTVTAAPACSGGTTNIVLAGLLPSTTGVATYKIGNSQLFTQAGTTTASGLFIFPTPTLSANANGLVVEITKITYANGCDTNFTGKKVTLVVQTCSPKEAITPVKGNQDVAGSLADLEGQGIKKVTLYPNPTSDVLNIQTDAGIQSVEIFNLQGQRVLTSQQKEITVSQLQAGAYLIRIQDSNNNVVSKKFIKK